MGTGAKPSPNSQKMTTPCVFFSLARGWLVASWSVVLDSKQANTQPERAANQTGSNCFLIDITPGTLSGCPLYTLVTFA
jgi:hypothetical protein